MHIGYYQYLSRKSNKEDINEIDTLIKRFSVIFFNQLALDFRKISLEKDQDEKIYKYGSFWSNYDFDYIFGYEIIPVDISQVSPVSTQTADNAYDDVIIRLVYIVLDDCFLKYFFDDSLGSYFDHIQTTYQIDNKQKSASQDIDPKKKIVNCCNLGDQRKYFIGLVNFLQITLNRIKKMNDKTSDKFHQKIVNFYERSEDFLSFLIINFINNCIKNGYNDLTTLAQSVYLFEDLVEMADINLENIVLKVYDFF